MAGLAAGHAGEERLHSAMAAQEGSTMVVTTRGHNAPGVTSAFLEVVQRSEAPVRILDVAQYVIGRALVLSVMLELLDAGSIRMMRDLLETSRDKGMQLDFHFPGDQPRIGRQVSSEDHHQEVSITMVMPSTLPAGLLHSVFGHLASIGGGVSEVEQRLENKIGWNGDCTKVCLRVSRPAEVPVSRLYLDLQKLCWRHGAEVAVREWDAMNRPNGKSLIVFGLSDVLCPYDVLDEMLKEAGVDPASAELPAGSSTPEARAAAKVALLKGRSASCEQRLLARLKYTDGARTVCRVLKDIGFSLALLTNTGGRSLAQAVKQELGFDYAIAPEFDVDENGNFTGQYAGDIAERGMRKADYLHLMAAKSGIHPRNVIVVGSFMRGLPKETAYEILDTYGPMLFFHAAKTPDLTTVLYLLGLSGLDVAALRRAEALGSSPSRANVTVAPPGPGPASASAAPSGSYRLVRVHSSGCSAAKLAKLVEPLLPYEQAGELNVLSMQQITMASGDAFVGVELVMRGADEQRPLKDLLFEAHRLGMDLNWDERSSTPVSPIDEGFGRYVLTVVRQPELTVASLATVFRTCSDLGVDCIRFDRLSGGDGFSALEVSVLVPPGMEATLRDHLIAVSKTHEVDIAFQRDGIERWSRRLIVFDMDSTLIQQEVIDELAKMAGVGDAVSEITERAMRGELDFHQSLRERVALLKGHDAKKLFDAVKSNIVYTPGAHTLCRTLKRLGYKMAVISGGFLPVAREVQRSLGLDYAFANSLEVERGTQILTGQTVGPVVTPQRKKALLSMIAEIEGCDLRQTIAVGDGSNDIPMLNAAGLGVAFCAKPKVQAAAEFRVNNKDLSTVLFLIGLSEVAASQLASKGRTQSDVSPVNGPFNTRLG